jgi:hypothetical protein
MLQYQLSNLLAFLHGGMSMTEMSHIFIFLSVSCRGGQSLCPDDAQVL